MSINTKHQPVLLPIAKKFLDMGFEIIATTGTSDFLAKNGVENRKVLKISEGSPNALDLMSDKGIDLIINTPTVGKKPKRDGYMIRCSAVDLDVPYITTVAGALAAVNAIDLVRHREMGVKSWNDYFGR